MNKYIEISSKGTILIDWSSRWSKICPTKLGNNIQKPSSVIEANHNNLIVKIKSINQTNILGQVQLLTMNIG